MMSPCRRGTARIRAGLVVASVLVLVLLAAAGCGKRPDKDIVRLRLYLWADITREADVAQAVQAFEATRPKTKVTVEYVPMGGMGGVSAYEQKLLILIAARDAPDVFMLPSDRFQLYGEKGALLALPLAPEAPAGQGAPAGFEIGGTNFGVPFWGGNPLCVSVSTKHAPEARELAVWMSRSAATK